MKIIHKTIFSLLLFCFGTLSSNAQLHDDFSDGDFTNNPAWFGDANKYIVNTAKQLQLNGIAANDTAYLCTQNFSSLNVEFNFYLRLAFAPSDNNLVRVYLQSDQQDLRGPLNGYFLRIGENGSNDAIEIYKQTGTVLNLVFRGRNGRFSYLNNTARIKILTDNVGNWQVQSDTTGGRNYYTEGNFFDNTHQTPSWFGVWSKYTSSNFNKFTFDEFYIGPERIDTVPPRITQITTLAADTVLLTFSEEVDSLSGTNTNNYTITTNGIGKPVFAGFDKGNLKKIRIVFPAPLPANQLLNLRVNAVFDLFGNQLVQQDTTFLFFLANENDVIMTELMADPDPVQQMPNEEYVELLNRTNFPINLSGWMFTDLTTTAILPNYVLQPKAYVIICRSSALALFTPHTTNIITVTSLPSLNNTNDNLQIKDPFNRVIHSVSYTDTWYRDSFKANGGFSLEMIDTASPCQEASNWRASNDPKGGTPGRVNSVNGSNPDFTAPSVTGYNLSTTSSISVFFSEKVTLAFSKILSNFFIDNAIGNPTSSTLSADGKSVNLLFANSLQPGITYTLLVDKMEDCSGNKASKVIRLGVPEAISPLDLIINEILFNPKTGGSDFVEFYNRSAKVIDLTKLFLANRDEIGQLKTVTAMPSISGLIFPGEYRVFSPDPNNIKLNYTVPNPEWLFKMTSMPSYNDDKGTVVLLDGQGKVIEEFRYTEKMHFTFIDDKNGVSLERLDPEKPATTLNNWFSAAESAGFGTPTAKNSQYLKVGVANGDVSLQSKTFSPNSNGQNDRLIINYNFANPGFLLTATVYDVEGRLVRYLSKNLLAANDGFLVWDGTLETGKLAKTGIYILLFEAFNTQGQTLSKKLDFVLEPN